jgi:outer membrane protein OmpA-like peptidoglycan-associated protein
MGSFKGEPEAPSKQAGWRRIALSFNKRALKVYYNQDRVLNIPNLTPKPEKFSIEALSHDAKKGKPAMIKNIRVAEGGVKLYDRVIADGKFVTRGIYFESGKAVVKPESHGVLNEIATMMKEHPELRFRIEGHTDSDGDDAFNLKLSKQRAESVKHELVTMGIADSQFETDGFGESKAVDSNATPEGKANNRRVEFVKIS